MKSGPTRGRFCFTPASGGGTWVNGGLSRLTFNQGQEPSLDGLPVLVEVDGGDTEAVVGTVVACSRYLGSLHPPLVFDGLVGGGDAVEAGAGLLLVVASHVAHRRGVRSRLKESRPLRLATNTNWTCVI